MKPKKSKKQMHVALEKARDLYLVNPNLSYERIADHVGVSATTVAKWYHTGRLNNNTRGVVNVLANTEISLERYYSD
jgi:transposase